MAKIVAVSVENTSFSFDKLYSYALPAGMNPAPGCRVLVPFGKGNRIRTGIVCRIENGDTTGLKVVHRLMDETPILSDLQMALCEFIAEQTLSSLYCVQNLCIPAGMKYRQKITYKCHKSPENFANEREKKLYELIASAKSGRSDSYLLERGYDEADPALRSLLGQEILVRTGDYVRKLGDAGVKMVRLLAEVSEDLQEAIIPSGGEVYRITAKQKPVLELLKQQSANLKEICYLTGASKSVVDRLADHGIVEYDEVEIYRNPYAETQSEGRLSDLVLLDEQQKVYNKLKTLIDVRKPEAALLFGVTGSGKTAVFFKLMEEVLKQGRKVLFLVPEISLTAQTVQRLHRYFGNQVAVIHSSLGVGERLDEWKRIRRGEVNIVMGTRSAVFAPIENLGLIVMDEEQEPSYKSEQSPRFHARMAAKFLAYKENALFLMASATPEIESYYAAEQGKYHICTLSKRYNQSPLPETTLVDMTEEVGKGSERLSDALLQGIDETLAKGEQVILLCNRRGYETTVTCKSCKEVASCPNCSVALTYHKANHRLMCHYCGYSQSADEPCKVCGDHMLKYTGMGTQKIVEQLQECFPNARILRMDADTTLAKDAHEKCFSAFANREYDILVGTQMVAKGLDFPGVTLVGVLGADKAVYAGDFRGSQRVFNLITQVVGRSGRGEHVGRAIIQTMDPNSEPVLLGCKQDYLTFYKQEILVRKLLLYPPFCDLCAIGFMATDEESLLKGGRDFVALLSEIVHSKYPHMPLRALGPARAAVYRVQGYYRSRLLLKCHNNALFRDMLRETVTKFERNHPGCRVIVDTCGMLEF